MQMPVKGGAPVASEECRRLQVQDLLRADGSLTIESPDNQLSMHDTLIEGNFLHQELRSGLFLHLSDVVEERPFTATSMIQDGLSCIFFLDGEVELTIGDRDFTFGGQERRAAVTGTAIMNSRDEPFRRASPRRQRLRHLVVSASPEWLNVDALAEVDNEKRAAQLLADHLTEHRWTLSARTVELVRQILAPPPLVPALRSLYLEGRAVEIVLETLSAVQQVGRRTNGHAQFTRQDSMRLQRAVDLIMARLNEPLSVEAIAREAGISASGLQRLFRETKGQSIFEFVRQQRLETAFAVLQGGETTIAEASLIAGYSNPANFSTAFRRRFGVAPSEVRRGRSVPL